ncbi:hemin uptake protein HemP [uncultured Cohaesibacter sp.]|uniref:hemin uptake protein HemP n=1 Tax=uncultured Cohaesibacter sp. TaxID=1002546 RepID=UPI0029C668CA|nr:hemin uptake protein HemP [uncultured Cohaesibacter sp.]
MSQLIISEFLTHVIAGRAADQTAAPVKWTNRFLLKHNDWNIMTMHRKNGPQEAEPNGPGADIATIDSSDLFAGEREIQISHRGELYRLRITAQQKLILTK